VIEIRTHTMSGYRQFSCVIYQKLYHTEKCVSQKSLLYTFLLFQGGEIICQCGDENKGDEITFSPEIENCTFMIMHICKFILTLWYFEFILFLISSRSGPKPVRPQSSPVPVYPAPNDPASVFHYYYYYVYMSYF
jgi:hypothetical protein